jgi:hypothetical protein
MDPMTMQLIMQAAQQLGQSGYGFGAGDKEAGYASLGPGMGYFAGKEAKKKQKKLRKRIERQRMATQSIFGKGLGQQEALARQATQQQLGGFDTAKRAAEMAAMGAKRGVQQRGLQTQASLAQGLTNRGLGSTSVGANLGRGIAADQSNQYAGIDEALGQYFGNLAMGRAGIEAQGTENLAGLAAQRSDFDVQNANFWSPYDWQRLGAVDTRMSGMQQPQLSQPQIDPSMLAQLFQGQGG